MKVVHAYSTESKLEILEASNYGVVGEGHCRKARVARTDGWFDEYAATWRSLRSAHLETTDRTRRGTPARQGWTDIITATQTHDNSESRVRPRRAARAEYTNLRVLHLQCSKITYSCNDTFLNTVDSDITHTSRDRTRGMGFGRVWVVMEVDH